MSKSHKITTFLGLAVYTPSLVLTMSISTSAAEKEEALIAHFSRGVRVEIEIGVKAFFGGVNLEDWSGLRGGRKRAGGVLRGRGSRGVKRGTAIGEF